MCEQLYNDLGGALKTILESSGHYPCPKNGRYHLSIDFTMDNGCIKFGNYLCNLAEDKYNE